MSTKRRDARYLAGILRQLPLLSCETLHWDGKHIASQDVGLRLSEPVACTPVLAQSALATGRATTSPMTPQPRSSFPPSCAPVPARITEVADLTFYLEAELLEATLSEVIPRATGALVWLQEDAQVGEIAPGGHPALVVQTISIRLDGKGIELVPHLPANDPLFTHMNLVLQTALTAEGAADRLYAEALADALAAHFLRRYAGCRPAVQEGSGGLPPATLRRTLAYIEAHLEEALSLAALADLVQMSPNHFAHLFKQATGQTPHHYVRARRIARAQQLLAETNLPLSAIALQVGWKDQSYFTALFRKHLAMTPKAYRAATR